MMSRMVYAVDQETPDAAPSHLAACRKAESVSAGYLRRPLPRDARSIERARRRPFSTRTVEQKKALFRRIVELLGEKPGLRPEDVFVTVLDAAKENWSVGHGLAQFA
jgi:phenylpyruvate tautomerase PptA (4-oxalocrotonate tautomerase family)